MSVENQMLVAARYKHHTRLHLVAFVGDAHAHFALRLQPLYKSLRELRVHVLNNDNWGRKISR